MPLTYNSTFLILIDKSIYKKVQPIYFQPK